MSAPTPPSILVTGDIVVDHHLYEGGRLDHRDETVNGVHLVREFGGAVLIQKLIGAVLGADAAAGSVALGIDLDKGEIPSSCSAYALWSPCPKSAHDAKAGQVWRVTKALGYGPAIGECGSVPCPTSAPCFPAAANVASTPPDVLVLDDSGACFRRAAWQHVWCLLAGPALPWILLKLSGSIGTGDLWHALQLLPGIQERLVILISANQLRQASVRLSCGLSWERTAEHLLSELFENGGNPELAALKQARHLIVNFEHDGAIWIDLQAQSATLLYDPVNAEGEWAAEIKGDAFAYQTCLVAALACEFARHSVKANIPDALERGLAAMRRLRQEGHGATLNAAGEFQPGAGFPSASLAEEIRSPACRFARTALPSELIQGTALAHPWSILATAQDPARPPHPLHGLAKQIVLRGEVAIETFPQLRIGQLLTVSRDEMEAMRALRRLFVAYKAPRNPGKKPLSIGVFGAPGAGKSFGVKQLAIAMFGKPGAEDYEGWIEFNLSQFDQPTDLIGAFHQVRDRVLQGFVPVVFWDEFDSQAHKWLQYLLAPMQDGKFQEGQITHSLGKCVFIFAGGTSRTFEGFGPLEGDREAEQKFRLAKGPDFKSRLDGYLDVQGPNPRQLPQVVPDPHDPKVPPMLKWTDDSEDIFYPVRRALLIRGMLGMKAKDRPDIDLGLLTALLQAPLYKHGARSLEKVLEPFKAPKGERLQPLRRSRLPAPPQLRLHVDDEKFHGLVRSHRDRITSDWTQQLAPAIHEAWRKSLAKTGEKNANDVPFDELPEDSKASNRAAAARIPSVLALAGLELAAGLASADEEQAVRAHIEHHLALLADGEHEGWRADRIANGWRFAKQRDNDKKLHNCLVPFDKLSVADQNKDCNQVRQYPAFAKLAGLKIVFVAG